MDGFKQGRFKAGLNTTALAGPGPQQNQTCFKAESILSVVVVVAVVDAVASSLSLSLLSFLCLLSSLRSPLSLRSPISSLFSLSVFDLRPRIRPAHSSSLFFPFASLCFAFLYLTSLLLCFPLPHTSLQPNASHRAKPLVLLTSFVLPFPLALLSFTPHIASA